MVIDYEFNFQIQKYDYIDIFKIKSLKQFVMQMIKCNNTFYSYKFMGFFQINP
jgi:hypothetical protein